MMRRKTTSSILLFILFFDNFGMEILKMFAKNAIFKKIMLHDFAETSDGWILMDFKVLKRFDVNDFDVVGKSAIPQDISM